MRILLLVFIVFLFIAPCVGQHTVQFSACGSSAEASQLASKIAGAYIEKAIVNSRVYYRVQARYDTTVKAKEIARSVQGIVVLDRVITMPVVPEKAHPVNLPTAKYIVARSYSQITIPTIVTPKPSFNEKDDLPPLLAQDNQLTAALSGAAVSAILPEKRINENPALEHFKMNHYDFLAPRGWREEQVYYVDCEDTKLLLAPDGSAALQFFLLGAKLQSASDQFLVDYTARLMETLLNQPVLATMPKTVGAQVQFDLRLRGQRTGTGIIVRQNGRVLLGWTLVRPEARGLFTLLDESLQSLHVF